MPHRVAPVRREDRAASTFLEHDNRAVEVRLRFMQLARREPMKKLKLRRETIVNLTDSDLERARGGATIVVIIQTRACPVLTNGCTGGGCVETIGSGTSVINPSGG
jgi:hypothetical protein